MEQFISETFIVTCTRGKSAAIGCVLGLNSDSAHVLKPFWLAVDVNLGLGKTFEIDKPQGKGAFDVLLDPRVQIHFLENRPWSLYTGMGVLLSLFDLERSGVSQAGFGPNLSLGALLASDRHLGLFIEMSGAYFYDALAYSYREDTPRFSESTERRSKVEGDWFQIYRVTLGLRLAGF